MNLMQAIIMGLVQGLTEFLPVSSSAHLVFADHFLQLQLNERDTVSFDLMLHLGTLVAVCIYFRKDIWQLLCGCGQLLARPRAAWRINPASRLFVWLAVGTLPAAILAVALKDFFTQAFQNVPVTAALLLVTAVMLFWISYRRHGERTIATVNVKDALLIGLFQALAILPGISRSGATITGGLLRGLDRDAAPRFSFLLSMPIILAGSLFDLKETLHTGIAIAPTLLAGGGIAAAISGYLAVVLLLGIVRRGRLDRFAYYCAAAGIGMLCYWTLLVPKLGPQSVAGYIGHNTVGVNTRGELGPIEFGQPLQLRLVADFGLVAPDQVYALAPAEHGGMAQIRFTPESAQPVKGKWMLTSDIYPIRPFWHASPGDAGDTSREIVIILRNKWGIQNQVRLRLQIEPESLQRRTG